ncbi:MAG: tRNA 2-thiouridine(34) synthase MnmA [Anaerolineae bacterium]|nr:tRNA 2-thiouridine(34) synthase MnmA [Anaerolineae bacterium]
MNDGEKCVVLGMSGGVDSTVAGALLLEQGYDVIGVVLKTWKAFQSTDTSEKMINEAETAAHGLGIPLRVLEIQARFYQHVVVPFLDAYSKGYTPNPCILCNPQLKFAALLETADQVGAQWIATGHYARTVPTAAGTRLLCARSQHQDQAYMLYRLTQAHLTRLKLPLGEVASKTDVRVIARQLRLPGAEQHDSQDLCFMQGRDYRSLLHALRPEAIAPGPIVDEIGTVLGQHQGLPFYTVGQRGGLGISAPHPLYVLHLVPETNTLVVGPRHRLERANCTLEDLSFIANTPPALIFSAETRIRYRAPRAPATIHIQDKNRAHVTFASSQHGVAPGQSVVFYQGDEVLGGGVIA